MVYNIKSIKNNLIEKVIKDEMKKLGEFYGFKWTVNCPKVFIIDDRKTINVLKGKKTELWLRGWTEKSNIYILNPQNYEKESNHKYTEKNFKAFLKHELSHLFYHILTQRKYSPLWLAEGVAIYTSGQLNYKKQPQEFKNFLDFYDTQQNKRQESVYDESGWVVKFLVDKFGKEKLLVLIKSLKNEVQNQKQFENKFFEIYGFNLSYDKISKLRSKC